MDLLEGITGFEDSVRKCKSLFETELPGRREGEAGRECQQGPGSGAWLFTIFVPDLHSYLPCRGYHLSAHRSLAAGRDARGPDW